MKCDICGKDKKNIKLHKKLAHSEPVQETQQLIQPTEKPLAYPPKPAKSVEDIARILYDDIVKPLCEERNMGVAEWGSFDPVDYLKVAKKIKG